jgi:fibronectin-binding autotransporter adhesin
MKVRPVSRFARVSRGSRLMLGAAVVAAIGTPVMAADVVKLDTADNLELLAGWSGPALPGSADVAVFNSTLITNNTFTLGAAQGWGGIRVVDPAGPITINGTAALTLGTQGVNMVNATQNLTINTPVNISGVLGKYNWTVADGRTLTLNAVPTKAGFTTTGTTTHLGIVRFGTTGTVNILSTTLPTATTLLINSSNNPYATYGDSDWAARDTTGKIVPMVYTPSTASAAPAGTSVDVVTDVAGFVPTANLDTQSLRFNDPTPRSMSFTVGRTWTVRGILMTPNSGGATISGGFIRPSRTTVGSTLFPIIQNSTIGDLTINAVVGNISSGTAAQGTQLAKFGAGKVILTAANAHPQGTFIHEGTIEVGGANGTLSGGNIVNNGALILNRTAGTLTLNQVISGTGSMTFTGAGTYQLGGANTYTAANQLNGGLVEPTVAGALGTSNTLNFNGGGYRYNAGYTPDLSTFVTTISASGATIDTNGVSVAYAGPIGAGGAGGLTKTGAGTLTFNGANTYAGPTTVNGGKLVVGNSLAGNAIVNTGGSIGGVGPIAGSLTSNGGTIEPGSSVGTLAVNGLNLGIGSLLNIEFGASNDKISAGGSAITLDGGSLTLLQENTTTPFAAVGTYDIITGASSISGAGLPALSVANPQSGFLYSFTYAGNAVKLNIASAGVISGWITNGDGTWSNAGNWSAGIPTNAGDVAQFSTSLSNPATVTLDSNRSVGGLTFNSAVGYTIAGSGTTLTLNAGAGPNAQINAVAGSHTVSVPVVMASTNTQADIASGASVTLSGVVSGAANVVKVGSGTLVLSNTANTYTGATNVNGGVLQVGSAGSLGTNAALNLAGGGVVRYATGMTTDLSTAKTIVVGAGGGGIDTNGNDVTFATPVSGTGNLIKSGAGKLTLTAANTHTGGTVVNGGTLSVSANNQLGDPTTAGAIVLNAARLEATGSLSTADLGTARAISLGAGDSTIDVADTMTFTSAGAVSGAGKLIKAGPGTLTLAVGGSYSGGTLINAGTLVQSVSGALGSGATELAAGTLNIGGTTHVGALNITGTTGTIIGGSGGGLADLRVVTGAGSALVNINAGVFDLEGDMTGFTGTLDFQNAGGGTVRLNGTTLSAGATINLGANVSLSRRGTTGTYNIGALSGSGTVEATTAGITGTTTYVIGAKNLNTVFDGFVRDSYDASNVRIATTIITKVGTGKLTLNGFAYYSGLTTVQGGTLQFGPNAHDPIIGGPSLTLLNIAPGGADLQAGKVVFDYTGIASPASTVAGLLDASYGDGTAPFLTGQIRSTTITSTKAIGWLEDTTAQTVTMMVTLYGDATLDGTVNFDDLLKLAASYNQAGVWGQGDFTYDGQVNFDDLLKLASNYNQTLSGSFGGDWALAQAAVPEPTSLSLLGLGAAVSLRRRRR